MRRFLALLVLTAAFAAPTARADMIGTDEAAQPPRERVKALLARPEVVEQLAKVGVVVQDAQARVDAMSDTEVMRLAGLIDALPAGGVLTNDQLLIIILLVVLLVILL